MAIFISPSVSVQETDATLAVQEKSDIVGAMAIKSTWGPVEVPTMITAGEEDLAARFGKPTDATYLSFFVAADYLSYSPKMWVIRGAGPQARNASAGGGGVLVKNEDALQSANLNGIPFIAKYPGALGDGLTVEIMDGGGFDAWEFKNAFTYKPQAGEFAIGIVDGSGKWTGAGASKQTERLVVDGTVYGGTKQTQTLAFSGTAAGGVRQEETLTVVGVATSAALNVDGQSVVLVPGDDPITVASKIAAALAGNTARYSSAAALSNRVKVVFKEPAVQSKINDVDQSGIVVSSRVDVTGNDQFRISIYGKDVSLRNKDTAIQVTSKVKAVFEFDSANYENVTSPTTSSLKFTYKEPGQKAVVPSQTLMGVVVATTVDSPGDGSVMVTVLTRPVTLTHGDSSTVVAQKIFNELQASPGAFENIILERNSVLYSHKVVGKKAKQIAPEAQLGLTFSIDIKVNGRIGTLLEKFELMKMDPLARFADGTTQYFVDAINKSSKYVWVGDKSIPLTRSTTVMAGGADDHSQSLAGLIPQFGNAELMDVNCVIAATNDVVEQKAYYDVSDTRGDCMTYVSPLMSDVVNASGNEMRNVLEWRTIETNRETSYAFNDCNWALVYDKYNDTNRWIPCCGGTAGLWARTAQAYDPWISPAGHERGRYKNYIKLAWSPNKAQRDELYKVAVNPIVSFPGEGTLLYGDKTSLSRPSAFGHINTRQAFIVAEKSIANFAKQFLFELNDDFTRAAFVNAVRPFLRNMQARRAFEKFAVVVDERNNGPDIRAENKLVGAFYITPLYSINFIHLNFVAQRPGVSFEEVERS